MDLSRYTKLLGTSSLSEAFINDTADIINMNFHDNPSYKRIKIDGKDSDCTVGHTKKSTDLTIFLRPYEKPNKGMYIELEEKTYIAIDYTPNIVYPKVQIRLCNNVLKWVNEEGILKEYKCIVEGLNLEVSEGLGNRDNQRLVLTSSAELNVVVQYNDDTKNIDIGQRFIFDGNAYTVNAIDKLSNVENGKGIIILTIKSTGKTDTDNVNDGVADDTGNSGWGGW